MHSISTVSALMLLSGLIPSALAAPLVKTAPVETVTVTTIEPYYSTATYTVTSWTTEITGSTTIRAQPLTVTHTPSTVTHEVVVTQTEVEMEPLETDVAVLKGPGIVLPGMERPPMETGAGILEGPGIVFPGMERPGQGAEKAGNVLPAMEMMVEDKGEGEEEGKYDMFRFGQVFAGWGDLDAEEEYAEEW